MKKIIVILSCSFLFAACSDDISIEMSVEGKVQTISEKMYASSGTPENYVKEDMFLENLYTFNKSRQILSQNSTLIISPSLTNTADAQFIYEDGLLKEKIVEGSSRYKIVYTYDEEKKRIKESKYIGETLSDLAEFYTLEYDEKGNMVKKEHLHSSNTHIRYIFYEYDKKGNVTKETINSGFLSTTTTIFTYDSYNNPIIISHYGSGGDMTEQTEYIYTYDKKRNYTKALVIRSGKVISVVERTITYY